MSVGIIDGVPRLDLPYVEVQGTAEGAPFDRAMLDSLLTLAEKGCADLTAMQRAALAG